MPLQRRLTLALLIVVLGPVLVSLSAVAFFANKRVQELEHRELQRAEKAVQSAVASLCERAYAAAEVIAATHPTPGVAQRMIARDTVHAVRIVQVVAVQDTSIETEVLDNADPYNVLDTAWEECHSVQSPQAVIAAEAPLPSGSGESAGRAKAAFLVNARLIEELERVSGAHVAVMVDPARSVGSVDTATQRVREMEPHAKQPLHILLGVPHHDVPALYVVLGSVVLIVAAASLFAAAWFTRTLTKPLGELVHAAESVSIGNLSTRVPVRGRDEAARLARAFNRMMHDLEKYVSALRTSRGQMRGHLTQLGAALAVGNETAEVLRLTLTSARSTTGAQRGAIFCARRTADEELSYVGACAEGFEDEHSVEEMCVPHGEGVVGRVAQSGVGEHGRVTAHHNPLAPGEPRCHTYLAVPFRCQSDECVSGVLVLYDRLGGAGDEFDDVDLSALHGFLSTATSKIKTHGVWQSSKNSDTSSRFGHSLSARNESST